MVDRDLLVDREIMLEKLETADREGFYIFYKDNNFREMTDEELERKYFNMMNFLWDSGTFTDW